MSANAVTVPERLVRPHPFVAATRDAAGGLKMGDDGRLRIGGQEGILFLVVSREQLQRALRILQALLREAERLGYELRAIEKGGYEAKAGVAIYVREHAYRVQLVELTERVSMTAEDVSRWQREHRHYLSYEKKEPPTLKSFANGRLKLQLLGRFGGRSSWSEGPRGTLESKLGSVLEELENRAAHDDEEVAKQRRRAEEWQRQAEEQRERELRVRIEQARAARLADEVAAWRLSREVVDYVVALRAMLDDVDESQRQRLASWCDWAEAFAARSDPTQNPARVRGLDDERDRLFTQSRG